MARLANIAGKETVKAFRKAGWHPVGQVGSHKELSIGTLRALIRHSGLTIVEFLELL